VRGVRVVMVIVAVHKGLKGLHLALFRGGPGGRAMQPMRDGAARLLESGACTAVVSTGFLKFTLVLRIVVR
jgi:hypothetical protein